MPAGRADDFPTEMVDAGQEGLMVTQRSMPTGRADDLPTGRSMPARRADELPTGRSMSAGRADVMSTSVVDADNKVDEWRIPKCPEKPERQQSELQKEPEIRKNTGTRQSRRLTRPKNTETPEGAGTSETPEVRLKRKIPRNLDIRKKESRRPMRDRRPEQISAARGPRRKAGSWKKLRRVQSRRGAGNHSRRAEDPDEPQVELEGEC
jgi:hypothetical protein